MARTANRARWLLTLWLLGLCGVLTCGGTGRQPVPDSGTPGDHRLEILEPPGSTLALGPNETVLLRVRYLDPGGRPIAGAAIDFTLEGDGRGATLSGVGAVTDADGIAVMGLTAGAEAAAFFVRVTGLDAQPVRFEVAVSASGFAELLVWPAYQGELPPAAFGSLDALLYLGRGCPPEPADDLGEPDRVRRAETFGEALRFENLPVNQPYAVLVRGLDAADRVLAVGCAPLGAGQLVAGVPAVLAVSVADVRVSAAGRYDLRTTLVLPESQAPEWMAATAFISEWMRCPRGLEQALLDCVADAAYPDGTVDCVPTAQDASALAFEAVRGVPDAAGCRGPSAPGGEPALEDRLAESLDATGVAIRETLETVAALEPSVFGTLEVDSELVLVASPPHGDLFAWHRLDAVRFPEVAPDLPLSLGEQGNGVLQVTGLPVAYYAGTPPSLLIPVHAMSLHPAWCVWSFLRVTLFAPAGLPAHPEALLALWLASHRLGTGQSGLDAVQMLLCGALGQSGACLGPALDVGAARLQAHAAAGWDGLLSPADADLIWTGQAVLPDEDGDHVADSLGSEAAPFDWLVTLETARGQMTPSQVSCAATRQ